MKPALRYNRLDRLDGVYDDHLAIAGRQEPIQRSGGGRSYRGTTGSYSKGQPVVVVVAFEEYQRLCKRDAENTPRSWDLLLAIPRGSEDDGFELPCRTRDYTPRTVDF